MSSANNKVTLDEIKSELKSKLVDYLNLSGHEVGPNLTYRCFIHEDENPSASITRRGPHGGELWRCHACAIGGDIFTAAFYIDNLPIERGNIEFITRTVKTLCEKLGLDYDIDSLLTDEEREQVSKRKKVVSLGNFILDTARSSVKNKVVDVLQEIKPHYTEDYINEIVETYDLFSINLSVVTRAVRKNDDITPADVRESRFYYTDDTSSMVFGENNVIFPIRNNAGEIVAFYARRAEEQPKYIGTPNNPPIYEKSSIFYLMDKAYSPVRKSRKIYIVEGHFDGIAMHENGFRNTVVSSGKTLSDNHITMLEQMLVSKVVICFDNDNAGIEGIKKLLLSKIVGRSLSAKYYVKILPQDTDPDDFFNKNMMTKEDFDEIEEVDIVTWYIKTTLEGLDAEEYLDTLVDICKLIAQYTESPAVRTAYAVEIQKTVPDTYSDYMDATEIKNEINHHTSIINDTAHRQAQIFWDSELRKKTSPRTIEEKIVALEKMTNKLRLMGKEEEKKNIGSKHEERIDDMFQRLTGNKFIETGYRRLDDSVKFGSIPYLWIIGGRPQMGKSSFLRNLIYSIVVNEENDVTVRYYTVDDNVMLTTMDFISICGEGAITRADVKDYALGNMRNDPEKNDLIGEIEVAINRWKDLVRNEKVIVLGVEDGVSLGEVEAEVARTRMQIENKLGSSKDENGKKEIGTIPIFVYDNLMNMPDVVYGTERRLNIEAVANRWHEIVDTYNVNIIATHELTKQDIKWRKGIRRRPQASDMKESGSLEYRVGVLSFAHFDAHVKGITDTPMVLDDIPVFELHIAKNKTTGLEDIIFFKFHKETGIMEHISTKAVIKDLIDWVNDRKTVEEEDGEEEEDEYYGQGNNGLPF